MISRRESLKFGLAAGSGLIIKRVAAQTTIPQTGLVFPDTFRQGIAASFLASAKRSPVVRVELNGCGVILRLVPAASRKFRLRVVDDKVCTTVMEWSLWFPGSPPRTARF